MFAVVFLLVASEPLPMEQMQPSCILKLRFIYCADIIVHTFGFVMLGERCTRLVAGYTSMEI